MANSGLKSCLYLCSVVCGLAAAGLIVISLTYMQDTKLVSNLKHSHEKDYSLRIRWFKVLPYVFISVGALSLLTALGSIGGGCINNKSILYLVAICSGILFVASIATCIVTTEVGVSSVRDFVTNTTIKGFQRQIEDDKIRRAFTTLEKTYECCGVKGPSEYSLSADALPQHCCSDPHKICLFSNMPGCLEQVRNHADKLFYLGAGCSGIVAGISFLTIIISSALIKRMTVKGESDA